VAADLLITRPSAGCLSRSASSASPSSCPSWTPSSSCAWASLRPRACCCTDLQG